MRGEAHKSQDDVNVEILSQIILYNKNKVLRFHGYDSEGKKKQSWEDGELDLDLHVKGIKKQGAHLSDNGYSKNIVPIVPKGETIESTTHNTLGKDKISLEEVLVSAKKYLD